jgi:hypothetical protein
VQRGEETRESELRYRQAIQSLGLPVGSFTRMRYSRGGFVKTAEISSNQLLGELSGKNVAEIVYVILTGLAISGIK